MCAYLLLAGKQRPVAEHEWTFEEGGAAQGIALDDPTGRERVPHRGTPALVVALYDRDRIRFAFCVPNDGQ